jgi:predicted ATPase
VADALRAYQRARKVFAAELGIDPGPELRSLEEQILLADVRERARGNLPRQLTSFVGRDREVAQLAAAVRERPLVTLTGVGGVGKTRLALETAAAATLAEFPDGTWLCELAPVTDHEAVWEALAATFGLRPSPGRTLRDFVLDHLGGKRLLLVLDNCEHLLGPVDDAVNAVMQTCPHVAMLATSRERLAVPGERAIAVLPLSVPTADVHLEALARSDAVRLFCDRALDVNGGFVLSNDNAAAVTQLCRQLDGIPLAIELVAALVRSLSPADLIDRFDHRFGLLTTGSRSAPPRHQTLRKAIDWSYDMLTDSERLILNRMSVFAGGCDLAAAEAVIGDDRTIAPSEVAGLLRQLVDKSLVEIDISAQHWRYQLLETIRQYAHEQREASGESVRVRDRHLARYVAVAEDAGPRLRGRDQLDTAAELRLDTDNFRAAVGWAIETERADEALRLVVSLMVEGVRVGWRVTVWAESALAIRGAEQHQLYPLAAASAAMEEAMLGNLAHSGELVALAEDAQRRLKTHHVRVEAAGAILALLQGDLEQAQRRAQAWVDLARSTGDPYEIAHALIYSAATLQPDPSRAAPVAEEAVRVARDAEIGSALLYALLGLGHAIIRDQPTRAHALFDEAAEVGAKLDDRRAIATAVGYQAGIAITRQEWASALRLTSDAADQHLQVGVSPHLGAVFTMAAIALARLQRYEAAAVIIGIARARFARLAVDQDWEALIAATDQLVIDALGATRIAELEAHGANLAVADAVACLRLERDRVLAEDHE